SQLEVPDDLVRLSVGIEDIADLLGDLEQALG
ncbi:PLP-dependent transferase, partial [Mycobacterium tuberculosis]